MLALTACATTPKIVDTTPKSPNKGIYKYGKMYSMVICGDKEDKFVEQAKDAYKEFKNLGVSDEDIHFLAPEEVGDLEGIVDDSAFKWNVVLQLIAIKNKITENDVFFFYYIDHGMRARIIDGTKGTDVQESAITFPYPGSEEYKDWIYVSELEGLVKDMDSKVSVFLIDACYSGGFSKMAKGEKIIVATVDENNLSFKASQFSKHFMRALNYRFEADKNDDTTISIKEAFEYATKKDVYSRGPNSIWRWFFPRPELSYDQIDPDKVFLKK
ncbi:MAG: C13 family peptidase [Nanoarchaeota archaeon]|nr:C13 family peptidase [Nanoarchaeota archaeon]